MPCDAMPRVGRGGARWACDLCFAVAVEHEPAWHVSSARVGLCSVVWCALCRTVGNRRLGGADARSTSRDAGGRDSLSDVFGTCRRCFPESLVAVRACGECGCAQILLDAALWCSSMGGVIAQSSASAKQSLALSGRPVRRHRRDGISYRTVVGMAPREPRRGCRLALGAGGAYLSARASAWTALPNEVQ